MPTCSRAFRTTVRWGLCSPALGHWIVASARRHSVWRWPSNLARQYGSKGSTSPRRCSTRPSALDAAAVPADLRCADVGDLPFADQTFDLVVSAYMLEHLVDPRAGCGRWRASCGPAQHSWLSLPAAASAARSWA